MDVEQVMERIRRHLRRRRAGTLDAPTSAPPVSRFDGDVVAADFAQLHAASDLRAIAFTSHRRVMGPVVVFLKTILRKLLTPILEAQTAYNTSGVRVVAHLRGWIEGLDRQHTQALAATNQRIERLERQLAAEAAVREELGTRLAAQFAAQLAAQSEALRTHAQALHAEALEMGRRSTTDTALRVAGTERKLRRILHALRTDQPRSERPDATPGHDHRSSPLADLEPEFDYAGFEDRFRGTEQDIKDRQRIYLPHFEGRENVLDLGCGRGEFLELLLERGIKARGVDLDLDMVLLCRDKDLDVVRAEALAHLASLPDDSLGGIFAAQVVEHLAPERIIELVGLCHRKLAPGGALILETPNPKCLLVFAETFYRDLSHVKPIHPDTMKFLLEARGFHDVEITFLAALDDLKIPALAGSGADVERFNLGLERLNALLFGAQDYAVIGRKG